MTQTNSTAICLPINRYPGYRVGDDGSVWTCRPLNGRGPLTDDWRKLKPVPVGPGYLRVGIRKNGKRRHFFVHHLVLLAFVGPRPDGMECCHEDRNPRNNRRDNLRWDTHQANIDDRGEHGMSPEGSRNNKAKLTESDVIDIRREFSFRRLDIKTTAKKYKVHHATILAVVAGRTWKHV